MVGIRCCCLWLTGSFFRSSFYRKPISSVDLSLLPSLSLFLQKNFGKEVPNLFCSREYRGLNASSFNPLGLLSLRFFLQGLLSWSGHCIDIAANFSTVAWEPAAGVFWPTSAKYYLIAIWPSTGRSFFFISAARSGMVHVSNFQVNCRSILIKTPSLRYDRRILPGELPAKINLFFYVGETFSNFSSPDQVSPMEFYLQTPIVDL